MNKSLHQIVEEARERANKATPGPWQARSIDYSPELLCYFTFDEDGEQVYKPAFSVDYVHPDGSRSGIETLGNYECGALEKHNAEFIAHAREDIPAMADALERAAQIIESVAQFRGANDHVSALDLIAGGSEWLAEYYGLSKAEGDPKC
jgi:hypothetical protein